jgi:uncharacterized protein YndB with AHSA1/START domain
MSAREVAGPSDQLTIQADLPADAARVWDFFVDPALIERWWPAKAESDLRIGGAYVFAWPTQGWTLRGRYTDVEPGRFLGFTWQWDHEPDMPARLVKIAIEPAAGGSRVTVNHGTYGDTATEREDRQSHRDGWLHFLGRLGEALAADSRAG